MMRHRKEVELREPVARYFHRKGYRWQATELQFYEYNIDIYGFSNNVNRTVSIELKIENWRRAFEQSLVYQLCSDLVFMALPKESVHLVDQKLLQSEGLGLLSVGISGRCQVILEPSLSIVMSNNYKHRNIELLMQKRSLANAGR